MLLLTSKELFMRLFVLNNNNKNWECRRHAQTIVDKTEIRLQDMIRWKKNVPSGPQRYAAVVDK